jgi:hypothetical protein
MAVWGHSGFLFDGAMVELGFVPIESLAMEFNGSSLYNYPLFRRRRRKKNL